MIGKGPSRGRFLHFKFSNAAYMCVEILILLGILEVQETRNTFMPFRLSFYLSSKNSNQRSFLVCFFLTLSNFCSICWI